MGPRNSKDAMANFISEYDVIQKSPSESLTYLQHKKSQEQFLLRQFNFNDRKECEKTLQKMADLKKKLAGNKHVVPLKEYVSSSQDQYCSTFYKIYALFEYPQRTLDDEINERNLQKRKFPETQLWSILASCILGLSHLQKNGIKHYALKSSNILLSQQGIIQISDPFATGTQSNYDTALTKRTTPHLYLSPQQTSALQQQVINPNINPYKSDIWTLGMIMLQSGLLQYQDECYRDQLSRVHWQTLQYNINRFGQAYSQQLKNMVEYMLSRDQRARPDWVDLQEHVMKSDQGKRSMIQQQPLQLERGSIVSHNNHMDGAPRIPPQQVHLVNQTPNYPPPPPPQTVIFNHNKTINVTPVSAGIHSFSPRSIHPTGNQYLPGSRTQQPWMPGHRIQTRPPNQPFAHTVSGPSPDTNLAPSNPSFIQQTRPFVNIFPMPSYTIKTKIDQNLKVVQDDEEQTQQRQTRSPDYSTKCNSNMPAQKNQDNDFVYSNSNSGTNFIYQQRTASQSTPNQQRNTYSNFVRREQTTQNNQNRTSTHQHNPSNDGQLKFEVETFKMGSKYQGYKLNGMRHGHGKFFYQDGGMYDGQWFKNKMNGFGKLYYQSGKLAYEGNWKQDQFNGRGILYNQSPQIFNEPFPYQDMNDIDEYWTKYQGQFLDDTKNGHGILYLSNGQKFQGQFIEDQVDGFGTFYLKNGDKIKGRWSNNIKKQ